jgi:hypothetical protein
VTSLASAYGWERLPSLPTWRTYYAGARFTTFALTGGLTWYAAMQELYPVEALGHADQSVLAPTLTPTNTPTMTPTRVQRARRASPSPRRFHADDDLTPPYTPRPPRRR